MSRRCLYPLFAATLLTLLIRPPGTPAQEAAPIEIEPMKVLLFPSTNFYAAPGDSKSVGRVRSGDIDHTVIAYADVRYGRFYQIQGNGYWVNAQGSRLLPGEKLIEIGPLPRVAWLKITLEGPGFVLRAGSAIELLDYDSGDYQTEHGWIPKDRITRLSPASDCHEHVLVADSAIVYSLPGEPEARVLHRLDRFELGNTTVQHWGDYRALCADGQVAGWVRADAEMATAKEYERALAAEKRAEKAAREKEQQERQQEQKAAELAARQRLKPAEEARPDQPAGAERVAYTKMDSVGLRTEANHTSGVVVQIPKSARVTVHRCDDDGWCYLSYYQPGDSHEYHGYVTASLLDAPADSTLVSDDAPGDSVQYSKTMYAVTALNLRAGPSTEELKLRTIPAGSAVKVADCKSGWCPVSYEGESGWASASYLSSERPKPSVRADGPTGLPVTAEKARFLVASHIRPNKLEVTRNDELRVKKNPVGRGVFVYHPKTRFYGVERLIVWWVPEPGEVYPLNSPSKMVTPNLPWPREAGVTAPSTSEVVGYVFRGTPMRSP